MFRFMHYISFFFVGNGFIGGVVNSVYKSRPVGQKTFSDFKRFRKGNCVRFPIHCGLKIYYLYGLIKLNPLGLYGFKELFIFFKIESIRRNRRRLGQSTA